MFPLAADQIEQASCSSDGIVQRRADWPHSCGWLLSRRRFRRPDRRSSRRNIRLSGHRMGGVEDARQFAIIISGGAGRDSAGTAAEVQFLLECDRLAAIARPYRHWRCFPRYGAGAPGCERMPEVAISAADRLSVMSYPLGGMVYRWCGSWSSPSVSPPASSIHVAPRRSEDFPLRARRCFRWARAHRRHPEFVAPPS